MLSPHFWMLLFAVLNKSKQLELGEIIRKRRRSLRITQSTLADLSGVARHTITDIESGKGNPTLEILKKLLSPLGMKLTIEIAEPSQTGTVANP